MPSKFKNIKRPIIGFVGKIDEKIDSSLINKLVIKHPEWSLVFLGNFDGQRSLKKDPAFLQVKSRPNIYFLGWKDYAELPRYVRSFNVCLIPFVVNALTQGIYPLKLHECLSTGKPVVSTDLPKVRPFSDIIRIADDEDDFERLVTASLKERDEKLCARRIATAKENSWGNRAHDALAVIEKSLKERRV